MRREKRNNSRGLFSLILVLFIFAVFMAGIWMNFGETHDGDDTPVSGELEIHYIDIGQGDATLIKCGEHAL